jgi:hypothetical protein
MGPIQQGRVLVAINGASMVAIWVLATLAPRADFRPKRSVRVDFPDRESMTVVVGPTTCIRCNPSSHLVGMRVPPPLTDATAPQQKSWSKVLAVRDGHWKAAYLTEGKLYQGEWVVVMYATDGVQQRIPHSEALVSSFKYQSPPFIFHIVSQAFVSVFLGTPHRTRNHLLRIEILIQ